jgi:hypothetical protein
MSGKYEKMEPVTFFAGFIHSQMPVHPESPELSAKCPEGIHINGKHHGIPLFSPSEDTQRNG